MGFQKERRPVISTPAQLLSTTQGTIDSWPPVTVITSTDNVNFTLPVPQAGLQKTIVLDFTGNTGDVLILANATATVFNGSTANSIVCSSSQEQVFVRLVGVSTSQWAAMGSVTAFSVTTASTFDYPLTFAGSTKIA